MKKQKVFILLSFVLLLSSCADSEPLVQNCMQGHTYGFFGGLWHGLISPFSFIGSLFLNDIEVYAPNNNGSWYTFGFLIGVGGLGFSSNKS